jgi:hypothetical protein
MRALWALVVVFVAATSGRDPVDDAYRASTVVRTAQTMRANPSRVSARAAGGDHAPVSITHQLPPGLAATPWRLRAADANVLSTIVVVGARELAHVDIPGCSARGPPIA